MRSYLESSEASRPPTHRNDVQARFEPEPPRSPLQSDQLGGFGSANNERVAQANLVLQQQGETATPKRRTKDRARKTEKFQWGDGDSGYGGSPEIYGEGGSQRLNALLVRHVKKTSSDELHVIEREASTHTDSITPCNETSTSQPHFLPQTPKASRLWTACSGSPIASAKRKNFQGESYPKKASSSWGNKRRTIGALSRRG